MEDSEEIHVQSPGADTGNWIWGGPGSFCRGGCGIGDSRAQTALKIFSHRAHYTCRFHVLVWVRARTFSRLYSAIWTEFISFSHAIGFCFDRAFGCFAFPAHALVSSRPHPSDYVRGLSPCALSLSARQVSHDTSHSFRTFSPRLHQSSDRHVQLLRMHGRADMPRVKVHKCTIVYSCLEKWQYYFVTERLCGNRTGLAGADTEGGSRGSGPPPLFLYRTISPR